MWNIEKDGAINNKFPSDFKTSLIETTWICSKCGNIMHGKDNDLYYVKNLDFVYHIETIWNLFPLGNNPAGVTKTNFLRNSDTISGFS